jgi:hypothetical protein
LQQLRACILGDDWIIRGQFFSFIEFFFVATVMDLLILKKLFVELLMRLNVMFLNTALIKITFVAAIEDTIKIRSTLFFLVDLHVLL